MNDPVRQASRLLGTVEETRELTENARELLLRLTLLIAAGTQGDEIVFAAMALRELRPALAAAEADLALIAAACRAERREGWLAGFRAASGRKPAGSPALTALPLARLNGDDRPGAA